MDMDNKIGLMVDNIRDNLKIIYFMVMVNLFGQTKELIKVIILKIKNKVMEYFYGLMVEIIKVNGKMENNMEQVFILMQMVQKDRENGIKENVYAG